MDDKMKKTPTCDPCETDFQNEIHELVDSVKHHSREEHMEKQEELNKAFDAEKKKK